MDGMDIDKLMDNRQIDGVGDFIQDHYKLKIVVTGQTCLRLGAAASQ